MVPPYTQEKFSRALAATPSVGYRSTRVFGRYFGSKKPIEIESIRCDSTVADRRFDSYENRHTITWTHVLTTICRATEEDGAPV